MSTTEQNMSSLFNHSESESASDCAGDDSARDDSARDDSASDDSASEASSEDDYDDGLN